MIFTVMTTPRGFAPRTPLHALSRAASPARSVRVGSFAGAHSPAVARDMARRAPAPGARRGLVTAVGERVRGRRENRAEFDRDEMSTAVASRLPSSVIIQQEDLRHGQRVCVRDG